MGSNAKSVQLKVFVDKKKEKVMFAEAQEDFVEILFSFFTLPLGTIARLLINHADSKNIKVGSLTSLYQSVVNLNIKQFCSELCKDALVNPRNSSVSVFQKLKVNLDDTTPVTASVDSDAVFVKNKASFIITDDLNVLPDLLDTSIILLNSLGVERIDSLDEETMYFGLEEFSNLLKWSLLTNNPLTNLVLGGSKLCSCAFSSCIRNSILCSSPLLLSKSAQPQTVKLLVQKSKKKVLCAQVGFFYVDLLFSFLTIPLGTVIRLTMDNSSPVGVNNLYNSISRLGDGKYLKSEDVKTMLLCPKLANTYLRVTDLLPIYNRDQKSGHFLKAQGTFIVSDDLEVTVSSSISTISKFNTLGIPVAEIAVVEASVGEQEALLLLKASFTSTSALTDCFNAFMKNPTEKSST